MRSVSSASSRARAAALLVAALSGVGLVACTDAEDAIGSAAPQSSAPTVIVPPRQTTTTAATTTRPTPSTRPGASTSGPTTTGPATTGSVVAPSTSGGPSVTSSTIAGSTTVPGATSTTRTGSGGGSGSGTATTTATTAPPTTVDSGLAQHERTRLGKQPTGEERLVFDFTNRSPSAADVRYVTGPITSSSGATINVAGDNILLVTLSDTTGAGSYVGNGYLSPDTMLQWGFTTVVEAVRVSDRDDELVWAIGVRGRPRFVTETYDARFVVQVVP